jgi:hypothetical protein
VEVVEVVAVVMVGVGVAVVAGEGGLRLPDCGSSVHSKQCTNYLNHNVVTTILWNS